MAEDVATKPKKPPEKPPEAGADEAAAMAKVANTGATAAVSLGWQMAEVFREVGLGKPDIAGLPPSLPGIPDFPATDLWKLRLDQVEVGLARLENPVRRETLGSRISLPAVAGLRALNPRAEEARWAVLRLHREILDVLTAANFRLGKAYGLGVSLADLTLEPPSDEAVLRKHFGSGGLADEIVAAFDDLATVLPPHSAESVAGSVREWQGWLLDHTGDSGKGWAEDVAATLKQQGRRWRSILTAEKAATDTLGIDDFILAGEALFARFRKLTGRFLLQHWVGVLMALLATAGVVAVAISWAEGTARFWAVAVALFSSLGVSGTTVKNAVGTAKGNIQGQLWGAELDMAIVKAVTVLPGNAPASIAPPAVPMARANKAYRSTPTGPPSRPIDQKTLQAWGPQRDQRRVRPG